jgi:hypothetical protein
MLFLIYFPAIGAFIYILRVHHVFHAHTTHELLGYVGGGVTPRVCYAVIIFLSRSSIFSFRFNRVCIMLFLIYFPAGVLNCPVIMASLDYFS